jgi:hypothetical protein
MMRNAVNAMHALVCTMSSPGFFLELGSVNVLITFSGSLGKIQLFCVHHVLCETVAQTGSAASQSESQKHGLKAEASENPFSVDSDRQTDSDSLDSSCMALYARSPSQRHHQASGFRDGLYFTYV